MTETIVILAAGASSRMKGSKAEKGLSDKDLQIANTQSKALIPIDDRPVLDYLLKNAEKAGFTKAILIVAPEHDAFKQYYGDGGPDGQFGKLKLQYAIQYVPEHRSKPWGTADAVYQACEQHQVLRSGPFIVCNSDNLYSAKALETLRTTGFDHGLMAYDRDGLHYPMERIARFALMQIDQSGALLDIIEKPTEDQIANYRGIDGKYRVSMNIFRFDGSKFYPYLKRCPEHPQRLEKELPTALMNLVNDHPGSVQTFPICEAVPDLTAKEDIPKFRQFLSENYGEE